MPPWKILKDHRFIWVTNHQPLRLNTELYPVMYRISDYPRLGAALLSILFITVCYQQLGMYFGWVDDVLQANYFNGIPLFQPIGHFYTVHLIHSELYTLLRSLFPGTAWYGYWMLFLIFWTTTLFILVLIQRLPHWFSLKSFSGLFLIFFVLILVWTEQVYLVNFSRIAILMSGCSFILLDDWIRSRNQERLAGLIYTLSLFSGLLLRPEVSLIIFPTLFLLSVNRSKRRGFLLSSAILAGLFLITLGFGLYRIGNEGRRVNHTVSNMLSITDSKQTEEDYRSLIIKDVKYRLVFQYFLPDSSFWSEDTLNRWGHSGNRRLKHIRNPVPHLKYEISKAASFYPEVYHEPLNFLYKSLAFVFFNLLLFILTVKQKMRYKQKNGWVLSGIVLLGFTATVLLITLLSKMEDRVMNPALIILTLCHLVLICNSSDNMYGTDQRFIKNVRILILLFGFLIPNRVSGYLQVAAEKKEELRMKKEIINELNERFKDKIFLYDLWSMTLLHQSLLEPSGLSNANKHLAYGEYWSNFLPGQLDSLKTICPETDFESFFHCLAQREDVILVYSETNRAKPIEEYSRAYFRRPVRLRRVYSPNHLEGIAYSFIPHQLKFGYFRVEEVPQDSVQLILK